MPDWTSDETRRQAAYRDEYRRPKGKHRAQAPKPAQGGPGLPRQHADTCTYLDSIPPACSCGALDAARVRALDEEIEACRAIAQAISPELFIRGGDDSVALLLAAAAEYIAPRLAERQRLTKGETAITEECGVEGQHSECRRITIDGYECQCACHDDEDEVPL